MFITKKNYLLIQDLKHDFSLRREDMENDRIVE